MTAERRADASHQQRATDDARRSRGRGAEERAAATLLWRSLHWGALLIAALLISALAALTPRIDAISRRRSHRRAGLRNARHRAARLLAAEQAVAHIVVEAALLLPLLRLRRPILLLVVLDVRVRGFERLVLEQHSLHQRIGGVRRPSKSLADHRLGVGIARRILKRDKAIEQLRHQLAFLRCHVVLLGPPFWGADDMGRDIRPRNGPSMKCCRRRKCF